MRAQIIRTLHLRLAMPWARPGATYSTRTLLWSRSTSPVEVYGARFLVRMVSTQTACMRKCPVCAPPMPRLCAPPVLDRATRWRRCNVRDQWRPAERLGATSHCPRRSVPCPNDVELCVPGAGVRARHAAQEQALEGTGRGSRLEGPAAARVRCRGGGRTPARALREQRRQQPRLAEAPTSSRFTC